MALNAPVIGSLGHGPLADVLGVRTSLCGEPCTSPRCFPGCDSYLNLPSYEGEHFWSDETSLGPVCIGYTLRLQNVFNFNGEVCLRHVPKRSYPPEAGIYSAGGPHVIPTIYTLPEFSAGAVLGGLYFLSAHYRVLCWGNRRTYAGEEQSFTTWGRVETWCSNGIRQASNSGVTDHLNLFQQWAPKVPVGGIDGWTDSDFLLLLKDVTAPNRTFDFVCTSIIEGSVSSGTFLVGETITQASTGVTAKVVGVTILGNLEVDFSGYTASGATPTTATPWLAADDSHDWVGADSDAHFAPSAVPEPQSPWFYAALHFLQDEVPEEGRTLGRWYTHVDVATGALTPSLGYSINNPFYGFPAKTWLLQLVAGYPRITWDGINGVSQIYPSTGSCWFKGAYSGHDLTDPAMAPECQTWLPVIPQNTFNVACCGQYGLPQCEKVFPKNVEVGDTFVLTVTEGASYVELSYVAAAATAEDVVSGLKALWDASSNQICKDITATDQGDFLILSGKNILIQFTVSTSTTNVTSGDVNQQLTHEVACPIQVASKCDGLEEPLSECCDDTPLPVLPPVVTCKIQGLDGWYSKHTYSAVGSPSGVTSGKGSLAWALSDFEFLVLSGTVTGTLSDLTIGTSFTQEDTGAVIVIRAVSPGPEGGTFGFVVDLISGTPNATSLWNGGADLVIDPTGAPSGLSKDAQEFDLQRSIDNLPCFFAPKGLVNAHQDDGHIFEDGTVAFKVYLEIGCTYSSYNSKWWWTIQVWVFMEEWGPDPAVEVDPPTVLLNDYTIARYYGYIERDINNTGCIRGVVNNGAGAEFEDPENPYYGSSEAFGGGYWNGSEYSVQTTDAGTFVLTTPCE